MIDVLIVLIVLGVMLYLVENLIPMDASVKTVIRVVVILCICLWLLRVFGILDLPVPRLR